MPAFFTLVEDSPPAAFLLKRDGLHHPSAIRAPVARIHIHMLTPQTLGAVVSVAVAGDSLPAMPAHKILNIPAEFFSVYIRNKK